MKPKAIRCVSSSKHKNRHINSLVTENTAHSILAVVEDDCIYLKCPDRGCKRWNKIKIHIPGVKLDLGKVAFTHDVMPKEFVFGARTGLYKTSPQRITEVIRET